MTDKFRAIRYPKIPKDWDQRFLYMAASVAAWSKDPSTRVGAVAVRDRRVLATAYNGFPRGLHDSLERLNDRDTRLAMTVHAEMNLINQAARNGVSLVGATVYGYPIMPCSNCTASLIQCDIAKVVVPNFVEPMRWAESFAHAKQMFLEAGIGVERIEVEGPLSVMALSDFQPGSSETEDSVLRLA
jgi:dCMP deaminase